MRKVTQKDIDLVVDAMEEFLEIAIQQESFSVGDFFRFMEPKFKQAGYRDERGGGVEQEKVLILQDAGAGDFTLMSGVIREIRRFHADAHITLVVSKAAAPLAEFCPYVNEVIVNPRKKFINNVEMIFTTTLEFAYKFFLTQRFDICYAPAILVDTELLMYMSGARERITTYIYVDEDDEYSCVFTKIFNIYKVMHLATHISPQKKTPRHRLEAFFAILDPAIYGEITDTRMEVWLTGADVKPVMPLLQGITKPIYALCMGGSGFMRHYPPEKYARLVEMILEEEPTATFVILGGGIDDIDSAVIFKAALNEQYHEKILDLTDKSNYRQDAAIINFCDMYIGNDTGTMHVAAAMKCPVLEVQCFPADLPVIDGAFPIVYRPYGVPNVMVHPKHALPKCAANTFYDVHGCIDPHKPHCIIQIEPETILQGFHLLKERVAQNIIETLHLY